MAIVGNYAKPASTQESWGTNIKNQQAQQITMPEAGNIYRLGGWLAAVGSSTTVYLCLWDGGGTLVRSVAVTVAALPFALGNSVQYEADVAGYAATSGQVLFAGWSRDPGGQHQFGRYATPGTHLDDTSTVAPDHLTGNVGDSGGAISAYAFYTTNVAPNAPNNISPAAGAVLGDTTPAISWDYADADGDAIKDFSLRIGTDVNFVNTTYLVSSSTAFTTVGNRITHNVTTVLARGVAYWVRIVHSDLPLGQVSASTVSGPWYINSLPVVAMLAPNDVTGKLAKMVMTAGSGWASPRMEVSWSFSDANGHAQASYQVEVYNDNAGAVGTLLHASGVVNSSLKTYVVPATFVENSRYHVRVAVSDGLEWSSWTAFTICRARWGLTTHAKDLGSVPTSWSTSSLNTTVDATKQAITVEYNSSVAGGAPPDSWKSTLATVTVRQWVHYRVWLFYWGTSPGTSGTLNDITISHISSVIQPDGWLPNPLSTNGASITIGDRVFGSQSLKIEGNGTARRVGQLVGVEPDTNYILQGRIKSVGNSGGWVHLSDSQSGAAIIGTTPVVATLDWAMYSSAVWNSGARTSVWLDCEVTGAAATNALFDGIKLERGQVASPWTPGLVGAAATLDAKGIQVDASAGGVFRLRNAAGTSVDIEAIVARLVPVGVILMWSGQTTTIPSGWFLCDGANGTPDLRDRFIIGADTTNEATSGGTVSASAALVHTGHQHEQTFTITGNTIYARESAFGQGAASAATHAQAIATNTNPPSWDKVSTTTDAAHAAPKYYRLAFIMKG